MPTYSYRCKDCDHAFDIVQSFSDESLTRCPECAGSLRKIFGNVGVTFKGSGFYRNDSRGGTSESAASTNASSGSKESGAKGKEAAPSGSSSSGSSSTPAASSPSSGAGSGS